MADQLEAALRRHGHRMTAQRRLILEEIAAARGHIAADAIHRAVAAQDPTVNKSTVYRTLDLLERLGRLVHHHDATGMAYHHADEHGHLHLACLGCGHMTLVEDTAIADDFVERLHEAHGFRANLAHAAIFGVCTACEAEGKPPHTPHRHGVGAEG